LTARLSWRRDPTCLGESLTVFVAGRRQRSGRRLRTSSLRADRFLIARLEQLLGFLSGLGRQRGVEVDQPTGGLDVQRRVDGHDGLARRLLGRLDLGVAPTDIGGRLDLFENVGLDPPRALGVRCSCRSSRRRIEDVLHGQLVQQLGGDT
jgi:hypothetical protein